MNSTPSNAGELYKPTCVACDERGEYTLATEERHGEPYCNDCAQNRDEATHEASLSDGGSAPSGLGELQASADRLNREGRY